MAERAASNIWTMRAAFILLSLTIMFLHLIPLDTVPRRWAPPDFLLGFTFAWVLRRPDFVPVLSVAAVLLMADLVFQRPPGLYSLLTVIGSEYLRRRTTVPGESSFLAEWATVALVVIAMTVANRLVLTIVLVTPPALVLNLIQMILTIAAYPLIVLVTQLAMGVRKPALSETASAGGRP